MSNQDTLLVMPSELPRWVALRFNFETTNQVLCSSQPAQARSSPQQAAQTRHRQANPQRQLADHRTKGDMTREAPMDRWG